MWQKNDTPMPSFVPNSLTAASVLAYSSGVRICLTQVRYRVHVLSRSGIGRRGRLCWKWSVGTMLLWSISTSSPVAVDLNNSTSWYLCTNLSKLGNKRPKGPYIVHLSQGGHLVFSICPKNINLVEDVEILLPVKFHLIPFSSFRGEVKKSLSQSEARTAILFFWSAWKTQTWWRTLRSCFLSSFVECHSVVSEEKSKMSQPIISQGGHLVFPISLKNTHLVKEVEILLPDKFCQIPFRGFRGKVENVSAKQKPGRPSWFSDRLKKHKLGRGSWDLSSCQVALNSIQPFQRKSRKCLSQ